MRINLPKHALGVALAVLTLVGSAPIAIAQQKDLRTFLVGKWQQWNRSMIGTNDLCVLDLRPDGNFMEYIYVNGNTSYTPAWISGKWEIRSGNKLYLHNLGWFPVYTHDANYQKNGYTQVSDWTVVTIQIIDATHTRNDAGVATRVS
jgi:hypothetical protein